MDLIQEYEMAKKKRETAFFTEPDFKALIEYFQEEEEYKTALQISEDAILHYPYSATFYLLKAEVQIHLNQELNALDTLRKASLYAPGEDKIELLKVEAYSYLGNFKSARVILEQLKLKNFSDENWADLLLTESLLFECCQEYENMYYVLKQLISGAPDYDQALTRFWLAVQLSKKHQESIAVFEELIELNPYASNAWYHLGQTYAYLGRYEEAIDAYEFAIFSGDKFEVAYKDCAELCFEIKDYEKAIIWYSEVLELFEADSDLFLRIGQCYQYIGQYALARTFLTRAMHLDHLNDEVYFHIGACFANEKKWRSAINAFEKALKIEDGREEYYTAVGEAYYEIGAMDKADEAFQRAIDILPEESAYWTNYASFLLDIDKPEDALNVMHAAADYLDAPEITYCRIACLFALGHRQEAYYWLGEALCENFNMHRSLFEWLPQLEEDPTVISLISSYMV